VFAIWHATLNAVIKPFNGWSALFPENIASFDEASVPGPIFGPAIRSPSPGQAASAIKSFAAVLPRSPFFAVIRPDVFSSVDAGPGSTLVFDVDLLPFFAQDFLLRLF
jgi:hypothetical protein